MTQPITHALALERNRDTRARERFVSGLRGFVLNDLAATMRADYESGVAAGLNKDAAGEPLDGADVHRAMRGREIFKAYSSARCTAQQMVWGRCDGTASNSSAGNSTARARAWRTRAEAGGSLELDPQLELPRYVEAVDVHLMPGCYYKEYGGEDPGGRRPV